MKGKRASTMIAESLGWDIDEVIECRYQKYVSPAVYSIGDRYFSVSPTMPKHKVGKEWVPYVDQFGARGTHSIIWVCSI